MKKQLDKPKLRDSLPLLLTNVSNTQDRERLRTYSKLKKTKKIGQLDTVRDFGLAPES